MSTLTTSVIEEIIQRATLTDLDVQVEIFAAVPGKRNVEDTFGALVAPAAVLGLRRVGRPRRIRPRTRRRGIRSRPWPDIGPLPRRGAIALFSRDPALRNTDCFTQRGVALA